jgi:hypothetical protein
MSILDLLQHIVNEPAPRLVSARRQFPENAVSFVEGCQQKDPAARKSPQELLVSVTLSAIAFRPRADPIRRLLGLWTVQSPKRISRRGLFR